jgi:hypothetical protein
MTSLVIFLRDPENKLTIRHKLHERVDVFLLSAGPISAMASAQLARHFDIPLALAETVLSKGNGPVATQMPSDCAKAAMGIMATLGVRLAAVPVGQDAAPERSDLCLHLTDLRAAAAVEQKLRDLGVWVSADRPDFYGPGGLQITDVCQGLAQATVLALGRTSGVDVISCAQSDALYDLFVVSDHTQISLKPMIKHLSDMGCHAADPWPALAVGLDRQMLAHFEARFPDHGLVCVNQAFQRYDLILTGLGDVSIKDFVDFLAVRGHTPSVAFDGVMQDQGMTIEFALSRKAAEQFGADYAMIGLHVRADFVRAQEKVIKISQVKPGFIKIA